MRWSWRQGLLLFPQVFIFCSIRPNAEKYFRFVNLNGRNDVDYFFFFIYLLYVLYWSIHINKQASRQAINLNFIFALLLTGIYLGDFFSLLCNFILRMISFAHINHTIAHKRTHRSRTHLVSGSNLHYVELNSVGWLDLGRTQFIKRLKK